MTQRCLVIGAGISGLAFADRYHRLVPDADLKILEASGRAGGVIATNTSNGYVRELGPETVLDDGTGLSGLLADIGIESRLVRPNEAAARRYIVLDDRLVLLPKGPGAFFRSKVLPFGAKLRLFTEPFRRKGSDPEESFGSFIARRFGPRVLENLAEPFASGIYAGIPEEMEMASCFPKLHEAEQRYGSVMKGLRKVGFKAGKVIGFPDGNQEIIDALVRSLRERILLNSPARSIRRDGATWSVELADGTVHTAERLVVTCASYHAAGLLRASAPSLAAELAEITHCSLASVHCAFDESVLPTPVDGFGFLIPRAEARDRALGILFSSNLFEGRAPAGKKLLRVLLGGARNPDVLPRSEEELVAEAKAAIARYLGITADPELVEVATWPDRLPLYRPGHQARLARLRESTAGGPPLEFLGSSFTGSGVALCIRNARAAAERCAAT